MVVIEEIFGVHEYIKDICRRYAKLGYLAIAPELFARQGDPLHADVKTIITDIVPKVPDAQAMGDLDATVAFAKSTGKADTTRVGGDRLLLGRPHDLALRPPRPAAQGGRGVLRDPRRQGLATERHQACEPSRLRP